MSLFDPFAQRSLTLRNRLVVSPMCEYSATDGIPDHWHLVHLGSRAVGGAAVVFTEATAVSAQGRISAGDTGLWNDEQLEAWQPIAKFIKAQGAIAGVQLAHAGRKASAQLPWEGGGALSAGEGDWVTVAPSALPFDIGWHTPRAMDKSDIDAVVADFRAAAVRAFAAGFELIELHAAHGYLLHQFMSELTNERNDSYGGTFENRTRIVREVVAAVRDVWPERLPLWLRISATDWTEHGWDIEQSVELAKRLKPMGVDLIDASSGGIIPRVHIPLCPGYQVPLAARIRREAQVATGAVGLITEAEQAAGIIERGEADVILMARESLRDPYFPRRAAKSLDVIFPAPIQYQRAW
ncbi:NADH:flavin oxidoreductase/NADH oxidase [Rhodanobacter sp. L36]|uniref:NADH:flavin oxidoreductase/NADH oxidase n=1 Tax=Rhodanobacter sp. L36 TaxID=1747221 RepID=UPI00131EBE40|nr:NADH:flavin oxidoreductase/NADH oxidase [Rhodanobacter sp. L36]